MPLVSTSALLLRERGRVIFFLQSSSRVTFFFETERATRCHLEKEKERKKHVMRSKTWTCRFYSQPLLFTQNSLYDLNQSQTGFYWLLTCHQPGWRLWTVGSPRGQACHSGPHTGRQVSVPFRCRAVGYPAHCRWTAGRPGVQPGPWPGPWWKSSQGIDLDNKTKKEYNVLKNLKSVLCARGREGIQEMP